MRVVIADDNYLLRSGLERLLETAEGFTIVASCGSYDELLQAVDQERPDAVLTDIRMPPTHTDEGVRAALAIRARHPTIGVVVLSQHASGAYALALMGGSADGIAYLLKDRVSDLEQLVAALRTVATGGSVVDPLVVNELISAGAVSVGSALVKLSERELEVLHAMAQGLSNGAIAASTFASERTVEKHINTIFTKLDLRNEPDVNRRVQAVLIYLTQISRSGSAAG